MQLINEYAMYYYQERSEAFFIIKLTLNRLKYLIYLAVHAERGNIDIIIYILHEIKIPDFSFQKTSEFH